MTQNQELAYLSEWKERLMRLLVEKSYKKGDFVLASGRRSDYYFDCRITSLSAEGADLIGQVFYGMLRDARIAGVAGMLMGAAPLVTATSMASWNAMKPRAVLNGLYVRKEPKDHGTGKQVEGVENFDLHHGRRIAVLEDVVTTGGSLLKACAALEKEGFEIVRCCAILDREEGGRENIEAKGYAFSSIFTAGELKAAAQE